MIKKRRLQLLLKSFLRLSMGVLLSLLFFFPVEKIHAQMPCINGDIYNSGITTLRVIGRGIEPERARTRAEAILMAERAAVADGYRKLTEKIQGVYIDSQSYIRNGSVSYSLQQQQAQTFLRGAEITQINRLSNGITEAELIIHLNPCNHCGCGCNRGCRSHKCRNCYGKNQRNGFFGVGFKFDSNCCN